MGSVGKARLALLVTVVVWGWSFVATKICLAQLRPFELLGLRFAIALPVLGILLRVRGVGLRPGLREPRLLAIGALLIGVHFFVQFTGLVYTSATNTGWIIATTPLVMAVLAYAVLRERLSLRSWCGVALATGGIVVLVSQGKVRDLGWLGSIGDWLILASAHTWALYTIATRDLVRRQDPQAVTFLVLIPVSALSVAAMVFASDWHAVASLDFEVVLSLVYLGVVATALGHWLWQVGVQQVGAAEAGLYLYLEPIATTVLAVSYLGEPILATTLLGGGLVVLGVWFGTRRVRSDS